MDEISEPKLSLKILGHQLFWSYEISDFNSCQRDEDIETEINAGNISQAAASAHRFSINFECFINDEFVIENEVLYRGLCAVVDPTVKMLVSPLLN